jgi:hypothetical protein
LTASFLAVAVTGCRTLGPRSIRADRFNYNQAGAYSNNEQILLNIIRLRYGEPIYFLDIGSMLSQYTFQAGADVSSWNNDLNTWSSPTLRALFNVDGDPGSQDTWGVNLSYTDRPTITYTPVQGEAFSKRLMSPIPPATVFYLAQSGWSIDRVFECCVQRMNDVNNTPIHDIREADFWSTVKFKTVTRILKKIQDAGRLKLDIEVDPKTHKTYLYTQKDASGFEQEVRELRDILGAREGHERFVVTPGGHKTKEDELVMVTRSLMGVLNALAQTIPVPQKHSEDGQVVINLPKEERESTYQWLTVEYARTPARDAFAQVYYNGYWWFIRKTDWTSKRTFALLAYLFALQASEGTATVPLVTVGTGG